jgi:DNA-binding NarL/FixJ family response regulator
MNQQVLIIDAHPVFIHKTAGFLKGLTINQIQLAVSGHEGIALAEALAPELVILSGN